MVSRAIGAERLLAAIDCLTHRTDEPYEDYIKRVATNDVARRVKIADLRDNLANNRRPPDAPGTADRISRYERALAQPDTIVTNECRALPSVSPNAGSAQAVLRARSVRRPVIATCARSAVLCARAGPSARSSAETDESAQQKEDADRDGEDVPYAQAVIDCVEGVGHDYEDPDEY
jgi:hypothetical protein